jgi:hypothetical protein
VHAALEGSRSTAHRTLLQSKHVASLVSLSAYLSARYDGHVVEVPRTGHGALQGAGIRLLVYTQRPLNSKANKGSTNAKTRA